MPKHKTVRLICEGHDTRYLVYVGYQRNSKFSWFQHPVCTAPDMERVQDFYARNGLGVPEKPETVNVTNGDYCPNEGLIARRRILYY